MMKGNSYKRFEQRRNVETCIYKTVLMIFKAVHIVGCIKKFNKYISLKHIELSTLTKKVVPHL